MTELFEKSIRVLELPQLLERLSQKAVSEAAKERALRLTPSTDADDVRRLQDETDAARTLIEYGLADATPCVVTCNGTTCCPIRSRRRSGGATGAGATHPGTRTAAATAR